MTRKKSTKQAKSSIPRPLRKRKLLWLSVIAIVAPLRWVALLMFASFRQTWMSRTSHDAHKTSSQSNQALGDGLLVLLIFAAGVTIFHRQNWFIRPGIRGYALMLNAGLVIGVVVEFVAVHGLGQWKYAVRMPILPYVGVGLAPIAQMVVLPPIIFRVVAAWWNPPQ